MANAFPLLDATGTLVHIRTITVDAKVAGDGEIERAAFDKIEATIQLSESFLDGEVSSLPALLSVVARDGSDAAKQIKACALYDDYAFKLTCWSAPRRSRGRWTNVVEYTAVAVAPAAVPVRA